MRRPRTALIAAVILATALSASILQAQMFGRRRASKPAPEPPPAAEYQPGTASRGARQLLRNGLDYLNTYGDPARALGYLHEAEARARELSPAEARQLLDAINRAERQVASVPQGRPRADEVGVAQTRRAPSQFASEPAVRRVGVNYADLPRVPTADEALMPPPDDSDEPVATDPAAEPAESEPATDAEPPVLAEPPAPAPIEEAPAPESTDLPPLDAPAPVGDEAEAPEAPAPAPELELPAPTAEPVEPEPPTDADPPAVAEAPPLGPAEAATPAPESIGLTLLDAPAPADVEPAVAEAPAPELESAAPVEPEPAMPLVPASRTEPAPAAPSAPILMPPPPRQASASSADPYTAAIRQPDSVEEVRSLPALPVEAAHGEAAPTAPAPVELAPVEVAAPEPTPADAELVPAGPATLELVPAGPEAVELVPAGPEPAPVEPPPVQAPAPVEAPLAPAPAEVQVPAMPEPSPAPDPFAADAAPAEVAEPTLPVAEPRAASLADLPGPVAEMPVAPPVADPFAAAPADPPPAPAAEDLTGVAPAADPAAPPISPPPGDGLPPLPVASGRAPAPTSLASADLHNGHQGRLFREETGREIEEIARRQSEEALRDPIQYGLPAGSDAGSTTSRINLPRAPSPTEARPIKPIPVPDEFVPLAARRFEPNRKYWVAPATCHMPLYFQDAVLERYGQSVEQALGPHVGRFASYPLDDPSQTTQRMQILQPLYSTGLFALQVAAWPYNLVVDPPWEAQTDLGYYRPGDPIPPDTYYLPHTGTGPPLHGRRY